MAGISTFANYSLVDVMSVVKIGKDIPLDKACLVGCGVATGYGSAVNSARIESGDTVIIMGIGGIGINAVQGASHSGALNVVAVDPLAFKREKAMEMGATHAFASIEEATAFAQSVTDGQGADSTIVCVGVTTGDHIAQGFDSIRKGGTVVMTGVSDVFAVGIPVSPTMMTLYQKRLQGSLYGEMSPSKDIPRLLDLYQAGKLRLDDLVTRTYKLSEINRATPTCTPGSTCAASYFTTTNQLVLAARKRLVFATNSGTWRDQLGVFRRSAGLILASWLFQGGQLVV
jgi:Zn-dependent alcohol dehydrogenase